MAPILIVAAALRLHGLNWDEGQLFHPDERWLVTVAAELHLPATLAGLRPPESPLNPFFDRASGSSRRFAYGHFPLYLLRLASAAVARLAPNLPPTSYEYPVLAGRLLAAAADLASVLLTYALGRRLFSVGVALAAAAGVALATLHVQLAHFFTVDPFLTALSLAALLAMTALAECGSMRASVAAGVATGLAIGTKWSGLLLLFPLVLAHAIDGFDAGQQARLRAAIRGPERRRAAVDLWNGLDSQPGWRGLLPSLGAAFLAFLVTNPYALADPAQFAASLGSESGIVQGRWVLPYTEQYRFTRPYLYLADQQIRWFLGPALGLLAWSGFLWRVARAGSRILDAGLGIERPASGIPHREWPVVGWGISYFFLTGAFFAKFPRYLEPLTPLLLLWGSALLFQATAGRPRWRQALLATVLIPSVLYALAFAGIYSQRHPWLQASEWIYRHVPPGATILVERWDQPLPVAMVVDGRLRQPREYRQVEVDPFGGETATKEAELVQRLAEAEWVALSSPRGWGVLARAGTRYPSMRGYYHALLAGDAGFEIAALWRVEPRLGPVVLAHDPFVAAGLPAPAAWHTAATARWTLDLGFADESFTVYDHPVAIVLRKTQPLEPAMLQARLWPERAAEQSAAGVQ